MCVFVVPTKAQSKDEREKARPQTLLPERLSFELQQNLNSLEKRAFFCNAPAPQNEENRDKNSGENRDNRDARNRDRNR